MEQTRKEYIESEFKKWEEVYEIEFNQEFEIKALLDLQYQFSSTPREHVKTIGDLIHTMNQIKRNLNLKPKKNEETYSSHFSFEQSGRYFVIDFGEATGNEIEFHINGYKRIVRKYITDSI
jgi:hypothetical protein